MNSYHRHLSQQAINQQQKDPSNSTAFKQALTEQENSLGRRSFLKLTAGAGGGFALASYLPSGFAADGEDLGKQLILNTFVEVGVDGEITLYAHTPEMGQGTRTSIPMIIAEELGADWNDVTVVNAIVDEDKYGQQRAGGSRSVQRCWEPMRQAGAAARTMFINAAAKQMGANSNEFYTEGSKVIHQSSQQSLSFAQLALKAAQEKVPAVDSLQFKDRKDYKLLGTEVTGVENVDIAVGNPLFGLDVQLPNMLHAVYEKCPAFFGTVKSANLDHIKSLPGVVDAFVVKGNGSAMELLDGIAIVAKSTWQAISARQQLKVVWDESKAAKDSWQEMQKQAKVLAKTSGQTEIRKAGDTENEFSNSDNTVVESFYTHPYVAHACMEPMNCTVRYDAEKNTMEVWAPTQAPSRIYGVAEKFGGVPKSNTTIHAMRMGGGFGRRGRTDFSSEAIVIAKKMNGAVKLTWTREDDMMHDHYRVGGFFSLKGAVDKQGKLAAMETHLIGPGFEKEPAYGVRLSGTEFPGLNIDNYRASQSLVDSITPGGPWRAPGSNVTAWAIHSFLDEMSQKAGRDHVEFLLELMGEPRWFEPGNLRSLNTGRAADVIKLAAEKGGWGKTLPKGRGQGLAFYFCHAGHVAEFVDLSVDQTSDGKKKITIHNITAAIDIGPIVNMSGAQAQAEGAIVDGLSTMLGLEITMENGRIQQNNFHQYDLMRIRDVPKSIDIHFIQSDNHPTGIGEPALPPLAPAIGNAIFAATGERVRSMPLSNEGFIV